MRNKNGNQPQEGVSAYEGSDHHTGTPLGDLRKDKGLNLEELSQKTGISKSALASYEIDDDEHKEINHGSLIALADFYEVSIDYLFCRTENREQINTPLV